MWVTVDTGYLVSHDEDVEGWISTTGKIALTAAMLPDYEHDLNACAEMEKSLSDRNYIPFSEHLDAIIVRDSWGNGSSVPDFIPRYNSGTAAQRVEAFLRTFDKWEK